jgi:hypothetical protein
MADLIKVIRESMDQKGFLEVVKQNEQQQLDEFFSEEFPKAVASEVKAFLDKISDDYLAKHEASVYRGWSNIKEKCAYYFELRYSRNESETDPCRQLANSIIKIEEDFLGSLSLEEKPYIWVSHFGPNKFQTTVVNSVAEAIKKAIGIECDVEISFEHGYKTNNAYMIYLTLTFSRYV